MNRSKVWAIAAVFASYAPIAMADVDFYANVDKAFQDAEKISFKDLTSMKSSDTNCVWKLYQDRIFKLGPKNELSVEPVDGPAGKYVEVTGDLLYVAFHRTLPAQLTDLPTGDLGKVDKNSEGKITGWVFLRKKADVADKSFWILSVKNRESYLYCWFKN